MNAIIDKLKELAEIPTPLIITHNQRKHVRIPYNLRFRNAGESWFNYCERLWVGCWKENGDDMIELTLHLGIYAEIEFMQEIKAKQNIAVNFLIALGDNPDRAKNTAKHLEKTLYGISVVFDLPEWI
jgi:hypothetical protein